MNIVGRLGELGYRQCNMCTDSRPVSSCVLLVLFMCVHKHTRRSVPSVARLEKPPSDKLLRNPLLSLSQFDVRIGYTPSNLIMHECSTLGDHRCVPDLSKHQCRLDRLPHDRYTPSLATMIVVSLPHRPTTTADIASLCRCHLGHW